MVSEPQVSVVIPTYNRSALLRDAVNSVLRQECDCTFEIVIVDNNSKDDTKAVVQSLIEEHPGKLNYVVETKQGNAHARNCGVKTAKADIIAFVDDDVTVESSWLQSLMDALKSHPELSFVGGSVLPEWNEAPPSWVTSDHWAPLALLDYGPNEFPISASNPRGLLTANIAFRKNVFEEVGMFSPDLQRVNNSIGSMEDHEFLLRVCRAGKVGMYLPSMITKAPVDTGRLTKEYHRRWHTGHGHFYAVMKDEEWERSKFYLMGVPSHLYKETATNALTWLSKILRGNTDAAFTDECRLRFFYGFYRQRKRQSSKN
jgi:glycosyltransferase involved in cell wall biosynthesis